MLEMIYKSRKRPESKLFETFLLSSSMKIWEQLRSPALGRYRDARRKRTDEEINVRGVNGKFKTV